MALFVLAWGLAVHSRAEATAELVMPSMTPTAILTPGDSPLPVSPAAFVTGATEKIEGELALLDGGPLSNALEDAVRHGRSLRLLLDPSQRSTRLQGVALQALSPSAQVRWKPRAGKKQRRLLADSKQLLQWAPSKDAQTEAGPEPIARALERFERQWASAFVELPEGQRLDDALQSLPDPTENTPHFIRRREASGE